MADLYTEKVSTSSFRGVDNMGRAFSENIYNVSNNLKRTEQTLNQQTENKIRSAKELYEVGLNVNTTQGLNKIIQNPDISSNPEALSKEMDKFMQETLSEVYDDELKAKVLADYEIKKVSILNGATNEFNKRQRQIREQTLFDSTLANLDNGSVSIYNVVSGVGSTDDLVNYTKSRDEYFFAVNAKNEDGTYVFSNSARASMINRFNQNLLDSFKRTYYSSDAVSRKQIEDKILSDEPFSIKNKDKDLYIKQEDAFGNSVLGDIKKFIRDEKNKADAQELREYNLLKKKTEMEFLRNPTRESLNSIISLNPNLSEEKLSRFEEILETSPNYMAETTIQGASDASSYLTQLSNRISNGNMSDEDNIEFAGNIIQKMMIANGEGYLSKDDYESFSQDIYNMLNDKVFAEQVHSIFGTPGIFASATNYLFSDETFAKIDSIGKSTIRDTMALLAVGDVEGAKNRYASGQREAIKIRYPEIPFDKLKIGDVFWYSPTSQAFKFLGYSLDDVLVEVDPNTGARM